MLKSIETSQKKNRKPLNPPTALEISMRQITHHRTEVVYIQTLYNKFIRVKWWSTWRTWCVIKAFSIARDKNVISFSNFVIIKGRRYDFPSRKMLSRRYLYVRSV